MKAGWRADDNERVIFPGEKPELISDLFENGDFLYHATTAPAARSIIDSGVLAPADLGIRDGYLSRDQTHSGTYAVSWSMNAIHAMPGTPHHLCGFLISPRNALAKDRIGLVPVDAADAEVQIFDGKVNVGDYKARYAQYILWRKAVGEYSKIAQTNGGSFSESNCIKSLKNWEKQYLKNAGNFNVPIHFREGRVSFSPDLLSTGLSPLGALILALAEGNDLADRGIHSFVDIFRLLRDMDQLNGICSSLPLYFDDELQEADRLVRQSASKTQSFVDFNTKDLTFVTSKKDFDNVWRFVLASSRCAPRAVILLDGEARIPNFSTEKGLGDHTVVEDSIRDVIPRQRETFSWSSLLPRTLDGVRYKGAQRMFVPADLTLNSRSIKYIDGKVTII